VNVEFCTDHFAGRSLRRLDPRRQGTVIEIGVGRVDFSFLWARRDGFRCIAVEPLPAPVLIEQARRTGTTLIVAAVSACSGNVPIYLGALDGHEVSDISSLNPRWWGAGAASRMVRSMTLQDILRECSVPSVSFLKLDTEGTEYAIISGLDQLDRAQLPLLVAIEYGGGGCRAGKRGGWTDEFYGNTIRSLEHLKSLGYEGGIVIDSTSPSIRRVDFAQLKSVTDIFSDDAVMGNFLAYRVLPGGVDFERDCALLNRACAVAARRAAWRERLGWLAHQRIRFSRAIWTRLIRRDDTI
jgi:FkbM family methyltransferase